MAEAIGRFEGLARSSLIGWAYSPDGAHTPCHVEVRANNVPCGSALASIERPDVGCAGHPSTGCGFEIPIADLRLNLLNDGPPVLLSVHEVTTGAALPGDPITVPRQSLPTSRLAGRIESVQRTCIRGWVYCGDDPHRHCDLEILDDNLRVIARSSANIHRKDLERAKVGAGDHGIEVRLPLACTARSESLVLRERSSQLVVHFAELDRFVGYIDRQSCGDRAEHLTGWALDAHDLETRLAVDLVADGRRTPVGQASMLRQDLRLVGIGDGRYGFRIDRKPLGPVRDLALLERRSGRTIFHLSVGS